MIPPHFDFADSIREGRAMVYQDGRHGYVDKTGALVIEPQFEAAWGFHEGLAAVRIRSNFGYIDVEGSIVIAAQFDHSYNFQYGLAVVTLGHRLGYLTNDGGFAIAPHFNYAERFMRGISTNRRPSGAIARFRLDLGELESSLAVCRTTPIPRRCFSPRAPVPRSAVAI